MCSLISEELRDAETFIIKQVQLESFSKEINALMEGRNVSLESPISSLSPILDEKGVLRVGGRLKKGNKLVF